VLRRSHGRVHQSPLRGFSPNLAVKWPTVARVLGGPSPWRGAQLGGKTVTGRSVCAHGGEHLGVHAGSHTHTSVATSQVHVHEQARSAAALRRVAAETIEAG
jgi:hypothetical protein